MSSSVVSLVKNIPEKVIFAKKFLKVNVIIHSFRESNAKFRDYDGFNMVLTIFKLEYKWQKSQQSCKLHKKKFRRCSLLSWSANQLPDQDRDIY